MKAVNTDVLIEKYGDWYVEDSTGKSFIGNMRAFIYDVVPTADVVEVVRCENCIHGAQRTLSNDIICPYMTRLMSPSDFCSHGATQ